MRNLLDTGVYDEGIYALDKIGFHHRLRNNGGSDPGNGGGGGAETDSAYPASQGYYSGSIEFDGINSYLAYAPDPDWVLGTGDFTVEFDMWQMRTNDYQRAFSLGRYEDNNNDLALSIEAGSVYLWLGKQYIYSQPLVTKGVWRNFAVSRDNGNIYFYIDKTCVFHSLSTNYNLNNSTSKLYIGAQAGQGDISYTQGTPFRGLISNFRWVKGEAVYTGLGNLDPNTEPLEAVPGTKLLLVSAAPLYATADSSGLDKQPVDFGGSTVWHPASAIPIGSVI